MKSNKSPVVSMSIQDLEVLIPALLIMSGLMVPLFTISKLLILKYAI